MQEVRVNVQANPLLFHVTRLSSGKLWLSYFCPGNTVAPPVNLIPTPRGFARMFCPKDNKKDEAEERTEKKKADSRYYGYFDSIRILIQKNEWK